VVSLQLYCKSLLLKPSTALPATELVVGIEIQEGDTGGCARKPVLAHIQGGFELSEGTSGKCNFDIKIDKLGAEVWCVF
jgi:hypothetical protein